MEKSCPTTYQRTCENYEEPYAETNASQAVMNITIIAGFIVTVAVIIRFWSK